MAYKPSLRRASNPASADLDIRPVMNLMVVLIPLLLAGAEYVKLAIIEVNLPPRASGGGGGSGDSKPEEKRESKLQLSVALTNEGIFIASPSGVLGSESEGAEAGPTVPLTADGEQDFNLLKTKLVEVKKNISGKGFVDANTVTITADKSISLQTISIVRLSFVKVVKKKPYLM
jgi:hypothetical protein